MSGVSGSFRPRSLSIGIDASRAQAAQPTGTESYALHVIRGLVTLDAQHKYSLYLRGLAHRDSLPSGPNVRHRLIRPNRLWTHFGLSVEMARCAPDVLFVPAHVLPAWRPRRSVVTVHDLGYLYYPRAHTRATWWYLHLSTAYHSKMATRLIADSEATRHDLVQHYGVDRNKIAVVPLGVDDSFQPERDVELLRHVRERYAGGKAYLLHLGTVQPRKNIQGLFDAYAALSDRISEPPVLVMAGLRGWLSDPIYERARSLGRGAIHFVDYVPLTDLPALLSGAIALVAPSFYEGFGLPALEAMACGTPVIASSTSSLPEVVGDAGLLIDPHDTVELASALETVVNEPELRDRMREKGRERAAKFTWSRCAEAILRVIEDAAP